MAKIRTKFATKVPKPGKITKGQGSFPHLRPPRNPGLSLKTQSYTKDVLDENPMRFGSFGFGRTGLTGES